MITVLYIGLVFLLVFANGFFVASEFALVGVRRSRIEMLAQSGDSRARRLLRLLSNLNGYISATRTSQFSRLPVYKSKIDEIVGVLYRKDLDMGRMEAAAFKIENLLHPPAFIPETVSAGQALRQMQSTRQHFVFVLNEHGGIEGILTLEDLLEEIVGEIDDEFDEETKSQIKPDGGTFILDGMLAIRAANQQLDLSIPEREGYTTIAGFLMAKAGTLLKTGDDVKHESGVFRVEKVHGRRIQVVRFVPNVE